MILLSTLPKNSLGIVKFLDIETSLQTDFISLGLDIGARVRLKGIKESSIVLDVYFQGHKNRVNITITSALKIHV